MTCASCHNIYLPRTCAYGHSHWHDLTSFLPSWIVHERGAAGRVDLTPVCRNGTCSEQSTPINNVHCIHERHEYCWKPFSLLIIYDLRTFQQWLQGAKFTQVQEGVKLHVKRKIQRVIAVFFVSLISNKYCHFDTRHQRAHGSNPPYRLYVAMKNCRARNICREKSVTRVTAEPRSGGYTLIHFVCK